MHKSKNIIMSVLFLLSLVLLIFCPICSMSVELNDGITKGICNVSIFTALTCSTILIDDFMFTLQSVGEVIVIIVILQCAGLILSTIKKSYIVGLMMVTISWILLLTLPLIVINVQSNLFTKYGSVQQQNVSVFILFILLPETVLTIFSGVNYFRAINGN